MIDGAGAGDVLLPFVVLLAFTAGAGAVAMMRFQFAETKTSWA